MVYSKSAPIPAPAVPVAANASQAAVGAPISPAQRLKIMSPTEWEEFILEWVDSLRTVYTDVHRCGGAGDLGRDVIGLKGGVNPTSAWDNYQCKHYGRPLSIGDAVAEIGKLLYHAAQGEFSLPDEYFFVAPQGPSTDLFKALQKGTLKQELIDRWDKTCRTSIAKGKTIERATMQATIDLFDFSHISVVPTLQIITGHQQTRYYPLRFGGGLPNRIMPIPKPPASLQPNEHVYIKKLLDAYTDETKTPFATVAAVQAEAPTLAKHLSRSREQFFSAESLRTFSRDNVYPGTFEHLQEEISDGVQDVYTDESHTSGYQRVLKTVQEARRLQITGNPLLGVMHINDRAGICHQLANDHKMTWVQQQSEDENS